MHARKTIVVTAAVVFALTAVAMAGASRALHVDDASGAGPSTATAGAVTLTAEQFDRLMDRLAERTQTRDRTQDGDRIEHRSDDAHHADATQDVSHTGQTAPSGSAAHSGHDVQDGHDADADHAPAPATHHDEPAHDGMDCDGESHH